MQILRNADRAIIEERKVRDYLLNPWHARGGHKALEAKGWLQS
jgi:hypothetical protein